jgi:thiamine pyrophosphate-dependent acetolactate synthase large subunit-like protein
VLNNGVLGYRKDAGQVKFGRYTSSGHLRHVDHAAIDRACGGEGLTSLSRGRTFAQTGVYQLARNFPRRVP